MRSLLMTIVLAVGIGNPQQVDSAAMSAKIDSLAFELRATQQRMVYVQHQQKLDSAKIWRQAVDAQKVKADVRSGGTKIFYGGVAGAGALAVLAFGGPVGVAAAIGGAGWLTQLWGARDLVEAGPNTDVVK